MPEAFPDFDTKTAGASPEESDGTAREGAPQGAGPDAPGSEDVDPRPDGPDPWKEADPYEGDPLDGTGAAGLMRRWAGARTAQSKAGRTTLHLADHVEAVESRLGTVLGRPLRDRGLDGLAARVERNPLAAVAGAFLAGWIVNRIID
ncbi:MAG: hypothetical protein ABFS34_09035 [Gemmatimonadota bacterium]